MTDNYIYSNGVLIFPEANQSMPQADNSKSVPTSGKLQTHKTVAKSKTRINLHLDNDILKTLCDRAELTGKCYETLINEILRHSLSPDSGPLTVEIMRHLLQEELNQHLSQIEEKRRIINSQYK